MDISTIQDEIAANKSTDIPTHEQRRLKKRAGTVTRKRRRTWVPGDKAKPYSGRGSFGLGSSNISEGLDPRTGKPHSNINKGAFKLKKEESEY